MYLIREPAPILPLPAAALTGVIDELGRSQDRSADTIAAALLEAFSGSVRSRSQPAAEALEAAR
jgi:hypothetical protein